MDAELRSVERRISSGDSCAIPLLARLLSRKGEGWAGESLPRGMRLGDSQGLYLWDTGRGFELQMLYVPPGEFFMGSEAGDWSASGPGHRHPLPFEFWIMRRPVLVGHFRPCLIANKQPIDERALAWDHTWPLHPSRHGPPEEARVDDTPYLSVSWHEARRFARWIGLRLPGEVEWEKSARLHPETFGTTAEWTLDRFTLGAYRAYAEGRNSIWRLEPWKHTHARIVRGANSPWMRERRGLAPDAEEHRSMLTKRRPLRPSNDIDLVGFRCVLARHRFQDLVPRVVLADPAVRASWRFVSTEREARP